MSALIEPHLSYHCEGDRASEFQVVGWVLARSHAKAGDTATISGYLGNSDQFDEAIDDFCWPTGIRPNATVPH